MKLNAALTMVLGIAGGLVGFCHDYSSYRDSVNLARKAGSPIPDFDFPSCVADVAKGFTSGVGAALAVSQVAVQ